MPRATLRIWILGVIVSLLAVAAPFAVHTWRFNSALNANQQMWAAHDAAGYRMRVASNSLEDCTWGWNTLVVVGGRVVEAHNDERQDCTTDDFQALTIEALFDRIQQECVRSRTMARPFPACNVSYDDTLGHPVRLDTYTFDEEGRPAPSITVEQVTLLPRSG